MEFVKQWRDHTGVQENKFFKTTLFRGDALLLGMNCLEPGQVQQPHTHDDQDKFYLVLQGNGRFWLGDAQVEAGQGEIVWAAAGVFHGVENAGNERLSLLVGIAPAP